MKKKALYNQFLVAFGVLVFFTLGLAIGTITSPSQHKINSEKKSDYELTIMEAVAPDSIKTIQ